MSVEISADQRRQVSAAVDLVSLSQNETAEQDRVLADHVASRTGTPIGIGLDLYPAAFGYAAGLLEQMLAIIDDLTADKP